MQKKILIISSEYPPGPGGIGNHAFNMAKYFNDSNYLVKVLTISDYCDNKNSNKFDSKNVFEVLRFKRYKSSIKTYIVRLYQILKYQRLFKFDLIICSGKFSLWAGAILTYLWQQKNTVAVVHGSELNPENFLQKSVTNFSLKTFNKIISVSRYTQSILPDRLKKKKNQYIIPNGISLEIPIDNKKNENTNKYPNFLTVGSITPRKGQANFIKAIPKLLETFPNLHYHCVGNPLYSTSFNTLADELDVRNHVTFYGILNHKELMTLYSNSEIVILLSETQLNGDTEGFGISILEANYFGVPAIGSNDGGIIDAIENYYTGILVNPKDTLAIFNAVNNIVKKNEFYSNNAVDFAAKHNWNIIGKKYEDLIFEK